MERYPVSAKIFQQKYYDLGRRYHTLASKYMSDGDKDAAKENIDKAIMAYELSKQYGLPERAISRKQKLAQALQRAASHPLFQLHTPLLVIKPDVSLDELVQKDRDPRIPGAASTIRLTSTEVDHYNV
tara:strand:- start:321 stop:704 length:384 start_codon:yes stop_codon:yes gene_type:complete